MEKEFVAPLKSKLYKCYDDSITKWKNNIEHDELFHRITVKNNPARSLNNAFNINSYGYATTYRKPGKFPALVQHSEKKIGYNFDVKVAIVTKN